MIWRVFPWLYFGDEDADTKKEIKERRITHILIAALDVEPKFPDDFEYHIVPLRDTEDENLLQYLDQTWDFIERGREESAVLVQCKSGKSASVAVIIAYLARKLSISLKDAFDILQSARRGIKPNAGFVKQLKEFHTTLQAKPAQQENLQQLQSQAIQHQNDDVQMKQEPVPPNVSQESITLPSEPQKEEKPIQEEEPEHPSAAEQPTETTKKEYFCRVCRLKLFEGGDVLEHEVGEGQVAFDWNKRSATNGDPIACTSVFIRDDLSWLSSLASIEGKLQCPKCSSKLGTWKWDGLQCSCGFWQTPAIQVLKTRVDLRITIIPNN